MGHLAVLLLVTRKLIGVDHGKHLGEALADTSDSLCWVAERQLVPGHELNTFSVHVNKTLLTRSAGHSAERFLAEHGVFFVFATAALGHDEIVKVLELLLVNLESFASVTLVSELLSKSLHNIGKTVLESLVHLGKVSLLV